MPHLDESEISQIDEYRSFAGDSANVTVVVKKGAMTPFRIGDIEGELTLISVETKMYAAGGCGNCLGKQITVRVSKKSPNGYTGDAVIGPRTRIMRFGPLRMTAGESEDGSVAVCIGL